MSLLLSLAVFQRRMRPRLKRSGRNHRYRRLPRSFFEPYRLNLHKRYRVSWPNSTARCLKLAKNAALVLLNRAPIVMEYIARLGLNYKWGRNRRSTQGNRRQVHFESDLESL